MSASTESNDWIDWHGGECPVAPETVVYVQLRGNDYTKNSPVSLPAKVWRWGHHVNDESGSWDSYGGLGDIIKYRIVGEAA